jgi:hypothetical protein
MNKAVKSPEQKLKVVCGNEPNSLIYVSHSVRVTNSMKHSNCIRQLTVPIYTTCQQHFSYCAGVAYRSWFILLSSTHTHLCKTVMSHSTAADTAMLKMDVTLLSTYQTINTAIHLAN